MEEVDSVFVQYRQTSLYSALKAIIMEYLDSIKREHFHQANENYSIEHAKPFTMATASFSKAQKEAYEFLAEKRRALRLRAYVKKMEELGRKCNPNTVSLADLGPDSFVKELEIIAVCLPLNTRSIDANDANLNP